MANEDLTRPETCDPSRSLFSSRRRLFTLPPLSHPTSSPSSFFVEAVRILSIPVVHSFTTTLIVYFHDHHVLYQINNTIITFILFCDTNNTSPFIEPPSDNIIILLDHNTFDTRGLISYKHCASSSIISQLSKSARSV